MLSHLSARRPESTHVKRLRAALPVLLIGTKLVGSFGAPSAAADSASTDWFIAASSNPQTNDVLNDVSCTAPAACTAVGYSYNMLGAQQTLTERWNGSIWAVVSITFRQNALSSLMPNRTGNLGIGGKRPWRLSAFGGELAIGGEPLSRSASVRATSCSSTTKPPSMNPGGMTTHHAARCVTAIPSAPAVRAVIMKSMRRLARSMAARRATGDRRGRHAR